jgi:hypothetical protein
MRLLPKKFLLFFFLSSNLFASPLFVSLGPDCLPAGMLRHFKIRENAYPFDWMRTLNEEGLLDVLNNQFKDFTNESYLTQDPIEGLRLVHSKYLMEFAHDWDANYWGNISLIQEGIAKLKMKYEKRIERFLDLDRSDRQVVFIRLLLPSYNLISSPQFYWFDYDYVRNDKEFAVRLNEALTNLFPNLNFSLILIDQDIAGGKIELAPNITIFYLTELESHAAWELILKQYR